jgi:hypothetical protein
MIGSDYLNHGAIKTYSNTKSGNNNTKQAYGLSTYNGKPVVIVSLLQSMCHTFNHATVRVHFCAPPQVKTISFIGAI